MKNVSMYLRTFSRKLPKARLCWIPWLKCRKYVKFDVRRIGLSEYGPDLFVK